MSIDRHSQPVTPVEPTTPPDGVEVPACPCGDTRLLEAVRAIARDVHEIKKKVGKRSDFDGPGLGLCGSVEILVADRADSIKRASSREGWVHRLAPSLIALTVGGLGGLVVNLLLKGHP